MNRIAGLDLIRATAIVLVVLNHTVEIVCGLHVAEVVNRMSEGAQWFALLAFTLARCGVPLFFFLSGYLLLPRGFDQQSTEKFYRRNWLTLLATWELWIVLYNLFIAALDGMTLNDETAFIIDLHEFQFDALIREMIFVEAVGMMHVWYVGVILGIYLFIPFVARVLPTVTDNQLLALSSIAFAYYFVLPTVDRLFDVDLKLWIDLSFSGGLYGFYVVIGYLLKRFEPTIDRTVNNIALLVSTIGLIAIIASVQLEFYRDGEPFMIWYDFCLLPIAAAGLFIALRRAAVSNALIDVLSRGSFGIYLLHAPLLILPVKFDVFSTLGRSAKTCCWLITVVALSSVIVKIFSLAPTVQRILFRSK